MSEPTPTAGTGARLEFWERREMPFFRALPYPLLGLCAIFDVAVRHGINTGWLIDLGLVAATALLMVWVDRLDRRTSWLAAQLGIGAAASALIFIAWAGLAMALVIRQPLYGFYSWTGYIWAWRLLRGHWRFAGVAVIALAAAISQTGSGPYADTSKIVALFAVYLVNLSVSSAFTWFGWIGNEQQEQRAREVSALTEANAKLEESLRQNADLQEQLLGRAREAGVVEERRRMAREIHDTLAQGLTGIITQLQAAQHAGVGQVGSEAGATHINSAIQLARESLTEARRSVQALTPEPLASARLPEAIDDVAQRWSQLHGVAVAFTTTGNVRLMRPEIEVALLRAAQEALTNVAKHARATRVGLTLSYMEDLITLDVRDDGVGFVTVNGSGPRRPRDAQGGFGLSAMRERVEGVAGTLEIESEPDGGTAISAAIPAVGVGELP
jgi:signal transduction histidine kinase